MASSVTLAAIGVGAKSSTSFTRARTDERVTRGLGPPTFGLNSCAPNSGVDVDNFRIKGGL